MDLITLHHARDYCRITGLQTMQALIEDLIERAEQADASAQADAQADAHADAPVPQIEPLPRYVEQLQEAERWITNHRHEHCNQISAYAYARVLHAANHLNARIAREIEPQAGDQEPARG